MREGGACTVARWKARGWLPLTGLPIGFDPRRAIHHQCIKADLSAAATRNLQIAHIGGR
jgi:hypothetical protein